MKIKWLEIQTKITVSHNSIANLSFIHTRLEFFMHFLVTVIGENSGHSEFSMGGNSQMINHSGGKFSFVINVLQFYLKQINSQ